MCVFHCARDVCIAQAIGETAPGAVECTLGCLLAFDSEEDVPALCSALRPVYPARPMEVAPSEAAPEIVAPRVHDVTCRNVRVNRSDRGSVFYLCMLSSTDPRFPKYPRLPVLSCAGYEKRTGIASLSAG